MAKRFTDTMKWTKPWIRKLKPVEKCFLFYLWDMCTPAGIWTIDFETAEYYIGAKLPRVNPFPADFPIIELDQGKKWFMPSFVLFQQPNGLQANNRAHFGIIQELDKYGIDYTEKGALKGLPSPLEGGKVIVKVIDKVIVKEPEVEKWVENIPVAPEIRHLWQLIQEECPVVFLMKKPLTPEQLYSIAKKHPFEKIVTVFRAMGNRPTLTKDYVSANLTAQNWLARDKKPEDRPMIRPEPSTEPELSQKEQDRLMLSSIQTQYALFEKGEPVKLTPGHYNFMVSQAWIDTNQNTISYLGEFVCNKKEMMEKAKDDKKDLTIASVLPIFDDPKNRAKILAAEKVFEAFKRYGTPWQM